MSTRTLAIMFTDIKGFTARTSADSRAGLVHLLDEHDTLLKPVFAHYGGTIVKTIGDAFLVWFASPTDAVVCGVTIQEVLRKHNAVAPEHDRIEVRISINIGDVELRGEDVFGEAVNLAARLEGITDAGEVWFTEAVYLTMNRRETPTAEVGERTFKGIPQPVRVYKVLFDPQSEQIRSIAAAVTVVDGVPRLAGLPKGTGLPAPALVGAAPSKATPFRLTAATAVAAAVVILGAGASHLFVRHDAAQAVARAGALLANGDPEGAVREVAARISGASGDPALIAVGVAAEEQLLDLHAHQQDAASAVAWAQTEMQVHPWAAGMRGRLPQIEAYAVAFHLVDHPEDEAQLDQLLAKYPKDAVVPYTAASVLESHGLPQYQLKYFEMALERGGYAGDSHIRELCETTFTDFPPSAAWCTTCQRIGKKWYARERLLWAEKHLAEGSANEFLNAWQVLHEEKRPEPEEASTRDLHDFLAGEKDPALRARLLAEHDPAGRARTASLVRSGLANGTFDMDDENGIRAFLADLTKR